VRNNEYSGEERITIRKSFEIAFNSFNFYFLFRIYGLPHPRRAGEV
jgi:hypothetical protein